jgi:hypothetical protein
MKSSAIATFAAAAFAFAIPSAHGGNPSTAYDTQHASAYSSYNDICDQVREINPKHVRIGAEKEILVHPSLVRQAKITAFTLSQRGGVTTISVQSTPDMKSHEIACGMWKPNRRELKALNASLKGSASFFTEKYSSGHSDFIKGEPTF